MTTERLVQRVRQEGMTGSGRGAKGLKHRLPSKVCKGCLRPMSWRRAWAKNWEEVRYCSDACRRRKRPAAQR